MLRLYITLIGILLTAQTACNSATNRSQSSSDDQLLHEVVEFASVDERQSAAWQSLQSRERSKLIADLTRISNASAPDDRNRVLIAFTFCRLGHDYDANRKIVLLALSKQSPFRNFGDWAASLVNDLMIQGDHDLLAPLFDACEWSDGAMSTELASDFSRALLTQPESFLKSLSSRREPARQCVLMLLNDYNLSVEEHAKVIAYLNKVPRQSQLGPIAEQTLRALK